MSLIPSAPFAADTLLPCERIFQQSDRSRESREISRALLLPFAIHARFQELKQPFFLFQRQCIRSCFDFSQRAHDGRLPLRGGACEEKVRDGEDTIGNTRRLRQGYGGPRRRVCSPDQIAVAAATATTALALLVAKKPRKLSGMMRLSPRDASSGAPLSAYLVTGTLTGLLGNRILLMSRSKTRAVAFVNR